MIYRIFARLMVGAHRALFTGATAVLGVGTSLIATDARTASNWCILLGAAAMMYAEDRAGDVDRDARTLAKGAGPNGLTKARLEVFVDRRPVLQAAMFSLALAFFAAWAVLKTVA